jgi:hypothetical protein
LLEGFERAIEARVGPSNPALKDEIDEDYLVAKYKLRLYCELLERKLKEAQREGEVKADNKTEE